MSWTQSWLTHWGPDEMAAILQTIFSKAFSSMKIFVFWLKFHRSLYLRVYLIDNNLVLVRIIGLAPNRRQVITWTNDGLFYRRIYASLGLIEIISVKSPKVFLFYLSTIYVQHPYVNLVGPWLTRGMISITCVMSVWTNDRNCEYMFMYLLKKLARKQGVQTPMLDRVWKLLC